MATRVPALIQLSDPRVAAQLVRYKIPELIKDNYLPKIVLEKMDTHSYAGFTKYAKTYTISKYKTTCKIRNFYVCKKLTNTTV